MPVMLEPLPYDYDALEPVISAATLKLHHGAHHRAYVHKLNHLLDWDFAQRNLAGEAVAAA
jgi:Fe-Mn family superoxide dismutase